MSTSFPTASVYTDIQGLQSLKNAADKNSPEALKEVTKQFEALFVQSLLKNMRAAKLDDGLLGSDQGDMYLDMFDKQMSLSLTQQKGIGIADMLYEQLKHTLGDEAVSADKDVNKDTAFMPINISKIGQLKPEFNTSQSFVEKLLPLAKGIAGKMGADSQMILAQAAMETDWGNNIIRNSRGDSSFNMFNIKVDADWKGPSVVKKELEYIDGKYNQISTSYKVYGSYSESFSDFLALNKNSDNQYATTKIDSINDRKQSLSYANKILTVMESEKMKTAISLVGEI